jgi:predicted ATP-grasp superfamily ATP-dependent carboligase
MTTVFVYEYCCAKGLGRDESDPAHSLYREGRAMRDAVADDFRRLPGVADVITVDDLSPAVEESVVIGASERASAAVIIAPEFDDLLETRCGWARQTRTALLNAEPDAISATKDKLQLADIWTSAGVPTPFTTATRSWPVDRAPAVVKRRDGAGSDSVFVVHTASAMQNEVVFASDDFPYSSIAQDFVPGRPASVALLIGPRATVPLVPTFQLLTTDGRFSYLGGELPIRPDLAARAVALGRRAVDCVPGLRGYVGVDLILGDAADGSQDYAIEINPRLTTSYVGLRQLADFNLAGAMLAVATGQPIGDLKWKPGRVRFYPDGRTDHDPAPGATFD